MNDDPFKPIPEAQAENHNQGDAQLREKLLGRRFAAWCIDMLVILFLIFLVMFPFRFMELETKFLGRLLGFVVVAVTLSMGMLFTFVRSPGLVLMKLRVTAPEFSISSRKLRGSRLPGLPTMFIAVGLNIGSGQDPSLSSTTALVAAIVVNAAFFSQVVAALMILFGKGDSPMDRMFGTRIVRAS